MTPCNKSRMSQGSRSNSLSRGTPFTKNYHERGIFTLDHFDQRLCTISEAAPIRDQMWSGTQSKTRYLHQIHIYLALAIEGPIQIGFTSLSSYFSNLGVRARYFCEKTEKPEYRPKYLGNVRGCLHITRFHRFPCHSTAVRFPHSFFSSDDHARCRVPPNSSLSKRNQPDIPRIQTV